MRWTPAFVTLEASAILYLPHAQSPVGTMSFVIRARQDAEALAPAAERTLWGLGRLMNVYMVSSLDRRLEDSFWQSRFTMVLLTIFAALAPAAAGMYAVISYLAAQRTREIGIRMALGARPRDVLWMVTAEGVGVAAIGLVAGAVAAAALGRLISIRLHGGPVTLAIVGLVLLVVAGVACVVPAARASRIDPLRALRAD